MLSKQDRKRIEEAVRAAEVKTRGEIVCVLTQTSSEVSAFPVTLAALAALALPWVLVSTSALSVQRILMLQVLVFAALAIILSLPRIRVALLPRATRRAIAHRVAMDQFRMRGVARTAERSGILIFVSLEEHYARIVADAGVASVVSQAEWQAAVSVLINHARQDRITDGFVEAIRMCGDLLAAHFPAESENRDELRNRLHVL